MNMKLLLDVIPVLLLLLCLYKASFVKPVKAMIDKEYLSLNKCNSLRGISAITIVLHHVAINLKVGGIFHLFTKVGFFVVCIFFFLSGYGLQKSNIVKDDYRKNFLRKRIPQVLIPYIVVNFFFLGMYTILGSKYSFGDIVTGIASGTTIVPYSWYIICILLFYIAYWLLMTIFKKNYVGIIVGAIIYYVLYVAFCILMGYGNWWYNSTILLIVGMIWATYEDRITKFISDHYLFVLCLIILIFCMYEVCDAKIKGVGKLAAVIGSVPGICTTLLIVLIMMKVHFGNSITNKLGSISFEIYMLQGVMIESLIRIDAIKEIAFLYTILVLTGTFALGYGLHYVMKPVMTHIVFKE